MRVKIKNVYCSRCNNKLEDRDFHEGFCTNCAEAKYKSMQKMLIICAIVGSVLAIAFFLIVYLLQINSDGYFYGTELGFQIYYFFVTMELNTIHIIQIILFFVPFGVGTDAAFLPYFNTGYFEGNFVVNIFKWILCTVFAPIVIIYMLFHIQRLKDYVKINYRS